MKPLPLIDSQVDALVRWAQSIRPQSPRLNGDARYVIVEEIDDERHYAGNARGLRTQLSLCSSKALQGAYCYSNTLGQVVVSLPDPY